MPVIENSSFDSLAFWCFCLSRLRENGLISESYHGLSSSLMVTVLDGIHCLTKFKNVEVKSSLASSKEPCNNSNYNQHFFP